MKTLTSGAAAIAIQAAGAFLAFLVQIILARLLGVQEFGIFAFYFSLATIVGIWGRVGSDLAVMRIGGEATARGRPESLHHVLRHAQFVALAGGLVGGLVLVAAMLITHIAVAHLTILMLAALLVIPIGINGVRQAGLLVQGRIIAGLAPELILKPGLASLVFGYMLFAAIEATAETAMAIMIVPAVVSSIVLSRLLIRSLPERKSEKAKDSEVIGWTRLGAGLMVVNASYLMFYYSDTLVLGYLLRPESIGPYQVAKQVSQIGLFAMISVQFAFSSRMAALVAASDWKLLRDLYRATVKLGAAFAASVLVAFVLLGNNLVALFGGQFSGAFDISLVFLVAQLAIAILGPVGVLASMSGNQSVAIVSYLIGAGLVFVLAPAFVQMYGSIGGAIVHGGVSILCAAGICVGISRKIPIGLLGATKKMENS